MKNFLVIILSLLVVVSNGQNIDEQMFASNISIKKDLESKSELVQLQTVMNSNSLGPRPGDELIKFSRMYYGGLGMVVLGTVIQIGTVLRVANNPYQPNTGAPIALLLGGFTSIAGVVVSITSFSYIGKAGRMMNQLDDMNRRELEQKKESSFNINSTKDGLGLVYNF